ncbi:MAG: FKBP-type peptidyl-prolyl cis-trans isomerase [Spirochaetota bacterium]
MIIENLKLGKGKEAKRFKWVTVHYTGWLANGEKFDSSLDRTDYHTGKPTPFTFQLGVGQVIKGWDSGLKGMKVGGKRKLVVPSRLGYGEKGAGNIIPPNSTLIFEVELLDVQ